MLQDTPTGKRPAVDVTLGNDVNLMPRFWVLTDHARHEVVLVLRGTMSLNELAVDLTCDPADFYVQPSRRSTLPAGTDEQAELDAFNEQLESMPGSFPLDLSTPPEPIARNEGRAHSRQNTGSSTFSERGDTYQVHGGMLKMARAMGAKGKPVHVAVRNALRRNHGYSKLPCWFRKLRSDFGMQIW